MSTIAAELYDALKTAGVPDDQAKAAAGAVVGRNTQSGLVTKGDLSQLESCLKADTVRARSPPDQVERGHDNSHDRGVLRIREAAFKERAGGTRRACSRDSISD